MLFTRARARCIILACTCLLAPSAPASELENWQESMLESLCEKYLGESPTAEANRELQASWLDRVHRRVGIRLAEEGLSGAPAEEIAMLALLHTRLTKEPASPTPVTAPPTPTTGTEDAPSRDPVQADQPPAAGAAEIADLGKGQEGLRQGIERLSELPLSERMVVTGDVNAGLQAMVVPDASPVSSVFGRFRWNVVARTVPADPDGRFSEGYFFLQLRAAGGLFDSTGTGHPPAFSSFNDIATDRSDFNEGLDRGNLYLGKAYYQQQIFLGTNRRSTILGQIGIVDFSDFFDTNEFANNEVRQFLNSAFVNSAAYKTAIGAPGAAGEYSRALQGDRLTNLRLRAGYAVSRTDKAFSSPLWNGEVELSTLLKGHRGNWRFGGSVGNVADLGGVRTFYLSLDQWVSKDIGVFSRFVVNNSGEGSLTFGQPRQSLSGGLQWRLAGSDDQISAWGFGFSQAWGIELDQPLVPERVFETYYRWQFTENFALTPDLQIVTGAGGFSGTHAIFGLRTNFGF